MMMLLLLLAQALVGGSAMTVTNRRTALTRAGTGAAAAAASLGLPGMSFAAVAATNAVALNAAKWTALDGFDSDFPAPISFIEFDEKAYKAMRDDPRRTPKFAKAIAARLAGTEGQTVLDLGTGPFMVLALVAVKYGAKKVYAVEANPEAARRARLLLKDCEEGNRGANGYFPLVPGQIEIIEGFSTAVTLPEKVDLLVAEICGSIASEEGLHATMRDARARHVKQPDDPKSWIPQKCQTYAAPVSYALQSLLQAPDFDWSKAANTPIRFNCRDEALQLLAAPQLIEDVDFSKPIADPGKQRRRLSFEIQEAALKTGATNFAAALQDERQLRSLLPGKDANIPALSEALATSLSGLAMWPTLVLDDETVVRSRGVDGEAQKSHWQTVLELMTVETLAVAPGDSVEIDFQVDLTAKVSEALKYELTGKLIPKA